MTYLAIGLVVVWLGGLLFLAGVHLNDLRLLHNNFAPGKRPTGDSLQLPPAQIAVAALLSPLLDLVLSTAWLLSGRSTGRDRFRGHLAGVDRSQLTDAGRAYLDKAVRHERIFFAYIIGGFVPIAWAGYLLSK